MPSDGSEPQDVFCTTCGSAQEVRQAVPATTPPPRPPRAPQQPLRFGPVARLLVAVVVVVGAVLIIKSATGDGRSAAAVCEVFETDGVALHDRYQNTADSLANDPSGDQFLGNLGDLLAAPGRLSELMSKMAAVAPEEIEPAFKSLAEAFKKVGESAGDNALNPLGALVNGLALGAIAQGPWDDVNQYLRDNCKRPG